MPPSVCTGCKKYSPVHRCGRGLRARRGNSEKGTTAPEGAGPELVGHYWRERFESSTEPCDALLAIHMPRGRPPGRSAARARPLLCAGRRPPGPAAAAASAPIRGARPRARATRPRTAARRPVARRAIRRAAPRAAAGTAPGAAGRAAGGSARSRARAPSRPRPGSPFRNFSAFPTRLGEPDRDRLLPAFHLLAGASGAQRSALALVHGLLDLLRCLATILACQKSPPKSLCCKSWTVSRAWHRGCTPTCCDRVDKSRCIRPAASRVRI